MGLFPLEDVRTMVFELSLIRSAFALGVDFISRLFRMGGFKPRFDIIGDTGHDLFYRLYPHFLQQHLSQ